MIIAVTVQNKHMVYKTRNVSTGNIYVIPSDGRTNILTLARTAMACSAFPVIHRKENTTLFILQLSISIH